MFTYNELYKKQLQSQPIKKAVQKHSVTNPNLGCMLKIWIIQNTVLVTKTEKFQN